MCNETNHKQAEELLEKALTAFGECEPPPGLEDRILRQVRAATGSRRMSRWLPAVGLAAALLAGVVLIRSWRTVEVPRTAVAELPPPPPGPAASNVAPARRIDNAGVPAPPLRRGTTRGASPVKRQQPVEESQISPLPPSELAFSDISSSPIGIEDLDSETTPLVSALTSDVEEGRER